MTTSAAGRTDAAGRLLPFRPSGEMESSDSSDGRGSSDPLTIGRRIRHHRKGAGLTLDALAGQVGLSPSALSLIENGKREPRLSALTGLATALGVDVAALLSGSAPSRRAGLEVRWERAQRTPGFDALGIPNVKTGPGLPDDALEALVGMYETVQALHHRRAATPEYARIANADLRRRMREADNYFPEIESAAAELVAAIDHSGGPVGSKAVERIARHAGYAVVATDELPGSTRTVTDMKNRRIYVPRPRTGGRDGRALALQALGHLVLNHEPPRDYAEFLAQRVEINYFAAAVLMPEHSAVELLQRAKEARDIAIEDLRDAFAVSYETAAHRFTNLATRHLGLGVHFMRISADGIIYKAYENDGVRFPMDATGAIEGARVCRHWTARVVFDQPEGRPYQQYTDTGRGTYWCTAMAERTSAGLFSVSVGVPFEQVRWMRGRDTTARDASRCPDPRCCSAAPPELEAQWSGQVWPSAKAHSHLLAVMPPGVFPGVDDTEVLRFVADHESD